MYDNDVRSLRFVERALVEHLSAAEPVSSAVVKGVRLSMRTALNAVKTLLPIDSDEIPTEVRQQRIAVRHLYARRYQLLGSNSEEAARFDAEPRPLELDDSTLLAAMQAQLTKVLNSPIAYYPAVNKIVALPGTLNNSASILEQTSDVPPLATVAWQSTRAAVEAMLHQPAALRDVLFDNERAMFRAGLEENGPTAAIAQRYSQYQGFVRGLADHVADRFVENQYGVESFSARISSPSTDDPAYRRIGELIARQLLRNPDEKLASAVGQLLPVIQQPERIPAFVSGKDPGGSGHNPL